jgi:hypothetical protein
MTSKKKKLLDKYDANKANKEIWHRAYRRLQFQLDALLKLKRKCVNDPSFCWGFCAYLGTITTQSVKHGDYFFWLGKNLTIDDVPHLKRYEPRYNKHVFDGNTMLRYWFPLDKEGWEKRFIILEKAIKNCEAEVNEKQKKYRYYKEKTSMVLAEIKEC